MRARLLRFGVQIPELLTQRKFVSLQCHAHSNAHKPPKTVAPTVLVLEMGARLLRFGVQIPELLTQRKFVSACHAHSNAHKPPKTVAPTVLMLE